ncbi:MAG: CBS domain-containing protein [Pirellulales bacterium]
MTLRDILHSKGAVVHTIGPDATLENVVLTLVKHNCGSLVVCAGEVVDRCGGPAERMVGIITERDILRACAARRGSLAEMTVAEVMTRDVATGSPDDSVADTMGLMTQRRIRHLPVLEGGQLVGLISIGDVVKSQHDQLSLENHYLKSYIQG